MAALTGQLVFVAENLSKAVLLSPETVILEYEDVNLTPLFVAVTLGPGETDQYPVTLASGSPHSVPKNDI